MPPCVRMACVSGTADCLARGLACDTDCAVMEIHNTVVAKEPGSEFSAMLPYNHVCREQGHLSVRYSLSRQSCTVEMSCL